MEAAFFIFLLFPIHHNPRSLRGLLVAWFFQDVHISIYAATNRRTDVKGILSI